MNQGWGTPGPVKYIDPQYKFPVGMKGFGNFSFRISDAGSFFINVMGQKDEYSVDELRLVIVSRLIQPLTDFLAEAKFGYNEIDANRNEIADGLKGKVAPILLTLGFELVWFSSVVRGRGLATGSDFGQCQPHSVPQEITERRVQLLQMLQMLQMAVVFCMKISI